MQIDWFTFSAQIINFLVLVWLLKKFLYKPVLAAMEKRKAALVARHQEAEEQKRLLDLFQTFDWNPDFDYKAERSRR